MGMDMNKLSATGRPDAGADAEGAGRARERDRSRRPQAAAWSPSSRTAPARSSEIKIDPKAIDPDDPEMLEDMVLAAVNEAIRSAQSLTESKLGGLAGGASAASACPDWASSARPAAALPLFADLDDAQLDRLAAATSGVRARPAGQALIERGRAGRGNASCSSRARRSSKPRRAGAEIGPGDIFGERSLLGDDIERTARVRAQTDVRCLAIAAARDRTAARRGSTARGQAPRPLGLRPATPAIRGMSAQ